MATTNYLLLLNDDCLFAIFKRLHFSQLIQIADTCKRLNTVAREYFRQSLRSSPSFQHLFQDLSQKHIITAFRIFGEYFPKIDTQYFNIYLIASISISRQNN